MTPETLNRFWPKVEVGSPDECWPWRAYRSDGYGSVRWEGRPQRAHRVAYTLMVGPIPPGLQLDHLCRNRACCNPAHLEPVTSRENTMRGANHVAERARQTRCINGHEFTAENTYVTPAGSRMCRACKRARDRRRYRDQGSSRA